MSNGHARMTTVPINDKVLGRSRSGRWFVIGAVLTLLLIWGTVFVVFREWRARHRELAAYGATQIAPLVDPLAKMVPPKVDAKAWKRAVDDTHGMLVAATSSGTMGRPELETLRAELAVRFAQDTPETAKDDLTKLWDEMRKRVGPILTGHPSRPPFCPPRPKILGGT